MTTGQTASKGQMGWGKPGEAISKNHDFEKRAFDSLADVVPERLMRKTAKPVINERLLSIVKEEQKKAGWDGGFSFGFLFKAIVGNPRDWLPQLIGSCVASGDRSTTVDRMLAEIFLLNDPETMPGSEMVSRDNMAFFAPFSYRAGRKVAGINGNGDGSLCLPHIEGKMRYGHLHCNAAGLRSDAYPEPQDTRYYKTWGANDQLLNTYAPQACCKLMESEKVRSAQESSELIETHYKPQNICSMWAFKSTGKVIGKDEAGRDLYQWTRDRRDEWAHNMQRYGYLTAANGKRYALCGNQWDLFHDGAPAFLVEESEDDDWVRDAEVQSIGELDLEDNAPAFPEA